MQNNSFISTLIFVGFIKGFSFFYMKGGKENRTCAHTLIVKIFQRCSQVLDRYANGRSLPQCPLERDFLKAIHKSILNHSSMSLTTRVGAFNQGVELGENGEGTKENQEDDKRRDLTVLFSSVTSTKSLVICQG